MSPLSTPPTTAETARLTELVLQCHPRQKLYLLGTTAVSKRTSSVFNPSQPGCRYTGHWFLLSLVRVEEGIPTTLRQAQGDSRQAQDDSRQAQGDSRQAQGDTRQAQGDTRQAQDDSRQAQGDTRQAQDDSRQAQGDTRQAQGDIRQAQTDTAASLSSLRVPQTDSGDTLAALQDKIENTLAAHFVPCTVLVLHLHTFNRWLVHGHPFAWTIIKKALPLNPDHDDVNIVATDIPVTPHYPSKDDIFRTVTFRRRMAKEFFDGAAFYRQKGTTDLAAFMLHQCAEQCLRALLLTTTGYEPNTHNIDKLLRYCSMTVHKVGEIFNTHNEENKRVYALLRRAYIDARYKLFVVMDGDLAVMTRKVQALMRLTRQYCKEGGAAAL